MAEVLIAMLTVFLLGGGLMGGLLLNPAEVEAIAARIEISVGDSDRVDEAGAIVGELRSEVANFDRIFIESGKSLEQIYRNHEAGSRPMLRALEKLNLEWYASQSRGLKLRSRLRETLTADEWAAVFGGEHPGGG